MVNSIKIVNQKIINKIVSWILITIISLFSIFVSFSTLSQQSIAQVKVPTVKVDLGESDSPDSVMPALKIVALLTILTIAPAIILMMTSFTRIVIVLSFVRQALGTQSMPPNQVIIGLSLFLTMFTMLPVWNIINENAINPYVNKAIGQETAFSEAAKPIRKFMLAETREDDLALFMNIAKLDKPNNENDLPLSVLVPSFMISELKTAFQMGFLVYIPFLIIDMVVSSILMAMGMMMLPPTVVSMPFKLVLFVLVDGWSLIVGSIVKSFNVF
ncbi:MAG: flagellar type III secretion system pore protein FliP [Bdellovibrionota bacterium]